MAEEFESNVHNNNNNNTQETLKHITPPHHILAMIESPVVCPKDGCHKTLMSKSVLNFHFSQCHQHIRLRPANNIAGNILHQFHCPVESCPYYYKERENGKHFRNIKYLKQHYLKVHASRNFSCKLCSKEFATASFLNAHLTYCDLQLICDCGKTFISIESILTHCRRMGHKPPVLDIYFQRIRDKRCAKLNIMDKNSKSNTYLQPVNQRSVNTLRRILPKHQPFVATSCRVVASGMERLPMVDVGTQVEGSPLKRSSLKCWAGLSCKRKHSIRSKKKETTEMETQTNLTNLKNRKRKSCPKKVSIGSVAMEMGLLNTNQSTINQLNPSTYYSPDGQLLFNIDAESYPVRDIVAHSHRITNFESRYDYHKVLMKDVICGVVPDTRGKVLPSHSRLKESLEGRVVGDRPRLSHKGRDSNFLDADLDPVGEGRVTWNIETQTDHDVLLCPHSPGSCDDNFLVSSDARLRKASPSLWCTSETQTCEDFSDIEQFLCSSSDTQTQSMDVSTEELFPELIFTTDTQTQTSLCDSTTLVTTHTQTYPLV